MTISGRDLRNALGRFATGVCVVTTLNKDGKAIGMTANSFSSLSLEPPLVLWSLQNSSEVYKFFAAPQSFAINILSDTQTDLSNLYSRKGDHLMDAEHYRLGMSNAPVLNDALVTFECKLHATHDGGDHLIIVGRVENFISEGTGKPLLFYCGTYENLR